MAHDDDTQPATKKDLRLLKEDLHNFATKEDFHNLSLKMDKGFVRLETSIDQVLTVVVNMNNRLSGQVDNHERRITKLESKV